MTFNGPYLRDSSGTPILCATSAVRPALAPNVSAAAVPVVIVAVVLKRMNPMLLMLRFLSL
jgi:hypothetical protein